MLVRYLDERRPALDYKTLATLAGELAGTFWADIERHHPGIGTLHLPDDIARAWKERARTVTAADGTMRERKNIHALLMRVRAFYLDIQQWALEDPSWAPWAVPSPVRRNDTQGYEKARRKTVAEMHQRVRERLPHLPALADAAGRCLAETTALLAAAAGCEPDEVFDHAGTRYRRKALKSAGVWAGHQGNHYHHGGKPDHRRDAQPDPPRGRGVLGLGDRRDAAPVRSTPGRTAGDHPPGAGVLPVARQR